jgi:hypothetical protein
MQPDRRVVKSLPLTELWDAAGTVAATRGARIGDPHIREMFRTRQPIQFIVADAGSAPVWVAVADARKFWMNEVRPRIVPADATRFDNASYPGRYCYVATAWTRAVESNTALVLLERHHQR